MVNREVEVEKCPDCEKGIIIEFLGEKGCTDCRFNVMQTNGYFRKPKKEYLSYE